MNRVKPEIGLPTDIVSAIPSRRDDRLSLYFLVPSPELATSRSEQVNIEGSRFSRPNALK